MTNYSDMSKGDLISLLKKRNAPAVQGEPDASALVEALTSDLSARINRVSRRSLDGIVVMSSEEWNGIVELVKKLLTATPQPAHDVQGEPVGWQFYQHGEWWNGDDRIKDHRKNTKEAGFRVRDVYAAPQPAPDVSGLVEELEVLLVSGHLPRTWKERLSILLAPYRNQGGES